MQGLMPLKQQQPYPEDRPLECGSCRKGIAVRVLVHSYQIDEQEALDCISLLKLGLDLGYLEGVSMQDLNALFFNSRRAHLLSHFEKEIKQEELSHQRASYIHTLLKKISLKL